LPSLDFVVLSHHGDHFDRVAARDLRLGDIDLCLIHLGGTRIAGILLTEVHYLRHGDSYRLGLEA
jgi:hypothetical protein